MTPRLVVAALLAVALLGDSALGAQTVRLPVVLPEPSPAPITIRCPCTITILDGSLAISPGASLVLSGVELAITSGHWASDSPATIQNRPPTRENSR